MIRLRSVLLAIAALKGSLFLPASALELFELGDSVLDESALNFPDSSTTKFGTTINGRTHQQWPMQTVKGYQYATYYDQNRNVCVARRKLPAGDWDVIRFTDYQILNNDSHNVTVIGISEGDGSIHLAFDHHANELKYRHTAPGVATDPDSVDWNADLFTSVLHELGPLGEIDRFTYPRFIPMPNGNLMLYYRYFTSGNGDSVIREYDATTHRWKTGLGKFIDRQLGDYSWNGQTSNYRYAYINAISYAGSRLHVTWLWRDRFAATSLTNNHDLCYAYSDDDGQTWRNNADEQIGVTGSSFIHLDSPGLVVIPIDPERNYINQTTHYAFPDGTVHVIARHEVANSTETRYHHYWRDLEGNWQTDVFPYSGSRPTLVGDTNKNLLLVYTSGGRTRIAHGMPNASKTAWTWRNDFVQTNVTDSGEGVIDFSLWQQEQILSTYAQESKPNTLETPTPLRVIDYKLTEGLSLDLESNPEGNALSLSWIYRKHALQIQEGNLDPDGWQYAPEDISNPLTLTAQESQFPTFYRLASPPLPPVFKRFDWDDGAESITVKHLEPSLSDGVLTLTLDLALHDPYLRMNEGSVDADHYHHVRLRVKNNTAGTNWNIFFSPVGGGESGNSLYLRPTANGDWETIEIDMRQDADWQGDINTIRFDFDTFQSGTVEIDFIEIYQ